MPTLAPQRTTAPTAPAAALRTTLAWAALFTAAAAVGRSTVIDGASLSLVCPAAGVGVLWLARARARPVAAAGIGLLTAGVYVATGAPVDLSALVGATNVVQAVVFVALATRLEPAAWGFGGRRPIAGPGGLAHVGLAAAIACLVSACVGSAAVAAASGRLDIVLAAVWWGRNTVGMTAVGVLGLLLGPLLSSLAHPQPGVGRPLLRPRRRWLAALEIVGIGVNTLVVYAVVFHLPQGSVLSFLVLGPTLWAGGRLGPLGATVHGLACTGLAMAFTLAGQGPFMAIDDLSMRALVAQLFVTITMVVGLSLAFGVAQEKQVMGDLRAVVDGSRLAAVVVTDLDGTVRLFGVGAERLLGHRAADVVGRRLLVDFHDPGELAAVAAELDVAPEHALAELARRDAESRVWTVRRDDGGQVLVRVAISALHAPDGRVTGHLAVAIDETRAALDHRRLAEAQARWSVLLDSLPDMTVLTLDADLRIGLVGGAGAASTGFAGTAGELLDEVAPAANRPVVRDAVRRALAGEQVDLDLTSSTNGHEHRVLATRLPVPPVSGAPAEVLVVARDVQVERAREREIIAARDRAEQLQDQLRHLAHHDPLTGLLNRRGFAEALHARVTAEHSPRSAGALLLLDLDHFKQVNDTLGHAAGDRLLATLANVLRARLGDDVLLARLGGDEFAALLDDSGLAEAERRAEDVVRAVREHTARAGVAQSRVTASVGGVLLGGRDAEALVEAADRALYLAKRRGRDGHVVRAGVVPDRASVDPIDLARGPRSARVG